MMSIYARLAASKITLNSEYDLSEQDVQESDVQQMWCGHALHRHHRSESDLIQVKALGGVAANTSHPLWTLSPKTTVAIAIQRLKLTAKTTLQRQKRHILDVLLDYLLEKLTGSISGKR